MDGKQLSVTPLSRHLSSDADDASLAGREIARHVRVVLLVIRRRHEYVDVLTDHVAFGVSEQALCSGIERLDPAVAVDHDDAVHRRFDNRSPPRFARTQTILEADSIALVVRAFRRLTRHVGLLHETAGRSSLNFSIRYRI